MNVNYSLHMTMLQPCSKKERCLNRHQVSMNKTDGEAQPILTQMGWYNHSDPVTGNTVRVQQQMWCIGPAGLPVAKGALRIFQECGLVGVENMRCDELRTL